MAPPVREKVSYQVESACDAKDAVVNRLLAAHEAYFDVSRDHAFGGRVFPGYGVFHSSAEKYVLVKRAKLWGVNVFEHLFIDTAALLDEALHDEYLAFMRGKALDKVELCPDHMTTYLSLVIIADNATDEALRRVRKARFRHNFMLGLKGWADMRLVAVDLSRKQAVSNVAGREMLATVKANAFSAGA